MLLALRFGFLNILSYSAGHLNSLGADFFSLPKAFLNLLEMRSMYDSWSGTPYGPYSTWYIYHPAFGLIVGFWFSFFKPWTGYWLFVLFSLALMAYSAHVLSRCTADPVRKSLCYLLMLCSFPSYWVLHMGNIHALSMLGLALILTALFGLAYRSDASNRIPYRAYLLSGLLLSFFTKPFALLYIPLLVMNRETRKTAVLSLAIYAAVSIIFLQVPLFNPEKVDSVEMLKIAMNPEFVKENLNVYKNKFVLNAYMKDNSMHWLHIIAQSDFYWNHVDIFSLAAFANTLAGRILPKAMYKIPLLAALALSILTPLIRDSRKRLELALLLTMALTLTFFLSYNTVWEYHFALFQPAVAVLLLMRHEGGLSGKWTSLALGASFFLYLPTVYFYFSGRETDAFILSMIRAEKVVPALLLYVMLVGISGVRMARELMKSNRTATSS
jgi:hypothetical protein